MSLVEGKQYPKLGPERALKPLRATGRALRKSKEPNDCDRGPRAY